VALSKTAKPYSVWHGEQPQAGSVYYAAVTTGTHAWHASKNAQTTMTQIFP